MISVENSETKDPPSTNDQVLLQSVETDYADKFISGFNSFEDFFEALTKIDNKESTPKQETKGHIFERFAKIYLLTEPTHSIRIRRLWHCWEIPEDIKQKIDHPESDEGIDLLAELNDGSYMSVQAKLRSNTNDTLTWDELSTFTALSFVTCSKIRYGLVITTCEQPLKKRNLVRDKIGFELLSDLEELDQNQGEGWNRLRKSIKESRPLKPEPRSPKPYQLDAIEKTEIYFLKQSGNTRGKLIMPCGTGKSLTAFWISKTFNPKYILYLVPSLQLVKQTIKTWSREFLALGIQAEILPVCSDDTVRKIEDDEFISNIQELGIRSTTEKAEIQKFLTKACSKTKIVIATYDSGKTLADASKEIGHTFDIGIFDEAHKTCGSINKRNAHLLFEKNVSIARRLFMTATERRFRGSSDTITSMDDPSIYGDTIYLLSFKDAAEKYHAICDYRIVTIAINDSEIRSFWEENKYLNTDDSQLDEDTTKSLATLIMLRKAFDKYNLTKAVSFHRKIELARKFALQQTSLNSRDQDKHPISAFHVSSKLNIKQRQRQLKQFESSQKGLISNARCLTEGVDIPAIDAILFADPKKSTVDIVQAVGRVMRNSPGKEMGYVLIPVVISDDETIDDFCTGSEFSNIISIVKSLATQDRRIVDYLRTISEGEKSSDGPDIFEFPEIISEKIRLEKLSDSIRLKLWEKIAKLNWRTFSEARIFAQFLKLSSNKAWREYANSNQKPSDIPHNPDQVYKNEWTSWGDFLGTGNEYLPDKYYRPFEEARKYTRSSGIKSGKEWREKWKLGELPNDLPSIPERVYKDDGFISMGDFLGTGSLHPSQYEFIPFEEARIIIRNLNIPSSQKYREIWKEQIKKLSIPATPTLVYKEDGWISWGDFLGSKRRHQGNYYNFDKLKALIKEMGISSNKEYQEAYRNNQLPANARSVPSHYAEYTDAYDFYGKQAPVKYATLKEIQDWARSRKIRTAQEWRVASSECDFPNNFPKAPDNMFRSNGWPGWPAFLGTTNKSGVQLKEGFVSYAEALKFAQSIDVATVTEWHKVRKLMTTNGDWPSSIPAYPNQVYQNKGWISWQIFLKGERKIVYMSYEKARTYARSTRIASGSDWRKKHDEGDIPVEIPKYPDCIYRNSGWSGWPDWLDNQNAFLDFSEARKYVQALNLNSCDEWRSFASSGQRPLNIPNDPSKIYKDCGWISWIDWLGNAREFLSYEDAKIIVHKLKLKSFEEWR